MPLNEEYRQQLLDYRADLTRLTESSQRDFDQQILALSGTAFGLSFTFADKFVPENCEPIYTFLFGAFSSWTLSILAVLFSFTFSVQGLRRATVAVDEVLSTGDSSRLHAKRPGGWGQSATEWLNILAGMFFVTGVVFIMLFVNQNNGRECTAPNEDQSEIDVATMALASVSALNFNTRLTMSNEAVPNKVTPNDEKAGAGQDKKTAIKENAERVVDPPEKNYVSRGMAPPPPPLDPQSPKD